MPAKRSPELTITSRHARAQFLYRGHSVQSWIRRSIDGPVNCRGVSACTRADRRDLGQGIAQTQADEYRESQRTLKNARCSIERPRAVAAARIRLIAAFRKRRMSGTEYKWRHPIAEILSFPGLTGSAHRLHPGSDKLKWRIRPAYLISSNPPHGGQKKILSVRHNCLGASRLR